MVIAAVFSDAFLNVSYCQYRLFVVRLDRSHLSCQCVLSIVEFACAILSYLFTNDRARELDNLLLWTSTENRKTMKSDKNYDKTCWKASFAAIFV